MAGLLFIDACMRENSRTLAFAQELLPTFGEVHAARVLRHAPLPPTTYEQTMARNRLVALSQWAHPLVAPACEFAQAEEIVIAAPYWNLGFPALLGAYLEHICTVGVTFRYDAQNRCIPLCKARALHYITTAGGAVSEDGWLGYRYLQALCKEFFGIPVTTLHTRQGLDL